MCSSMLNVIVCTWIKMCMWWTQEVNMNHLAHEALPPVLPNEHFTDLAGLITFLMNEILVFEKSWGAERRGKDKIDAMAD